MSKVIATMMLLLISGMSTNAAAQDGLKNTSKDKANKIHAYLEAIGVNNPKILAFTSSIGNRMEDKKIRLAEQHFESGRLVLHYAARPKISTRQLELRFQPTYSKNTEFVATTRSMMYNYNWSF